MTLPPVSPAIQERFHPYLGAEERLLWTGHPDQDGLFTPADVCLVPAGILWSIVAVISLILTFSGAGPQGRHVGFIVWEVIWTVLLLYFMFGRFFYKRWKNGSTYYAVSDSRVMTLTKGLTGWSYQSSFIEGLSTVSEGVIGAGRGRGSVTFGHASMITSLCANTGLDVVGGLVGVMPLAFYDIDDSTDVYRLVLGRRDAALSPSI